MRVKLVYFYDDKYEEHEGRLLGLLDNEQFAYLYHNVSATATKLQTGRSVTLTEIKDTVFKTRRIVLAILSNKGEPGLFITSPLEELYNCNYNNKQVEYLGFTDNKKNWITIEEG